MFCFIGKYFAISFELCIFCDKKVTKLMNSYDDDCILWLIDYIDYGSIATRKNTRWINELTFILFLFFLCYNLCAQLLDILPCLCRIIYSVKFSNHVIEFSQENSKRSDIEETNEQANKLAVLSATKRHISFVIQSNAAL